MKTFGNVFRKALMLSASIVLIGGVFSACKKDNADEYTKPEATISPADGLTFAAEGGVKVVTLDSNRDWTARSTQEAWLKVEPASGKAGKGNQIKVTATANKEVASREASVSIKYGNEVKTIKVTQLAAKGSETPQPEAEGIQLSEFLAKYEGVTADTDVTEEGFIRAVVISDRKANNVLNKKLLTVQSGDKGLVIAFPEEFNLEGQEPPYKRGDVVKINLKGTKISVKYGFQLNVSDAASMVQKLGLTEEVQPMTVTMEDVFAGKYNNVLVKLDGVQFKKAGGKLNNLEGTDKVKYPVKYHALTDCATEPTAPVKGLSVAISFFAEFKGQEVSDKKGSMTGIVARSNGKKGEVYYNLWIRDLQDLNLTDEPCGEGNKPTPNPEPQPEPARKMGLDDFVFKYKDSNKAIEDNVFIEGSILVEMTKDNYKPNSLTIQSGENGLTIYLPGIDKTIVKNLKRFDIVKVMAKGGKLERYNGGGLQLSFPQGTDANTIVSTEGASAPIAPKVLRLDEVYSGKYENILVQVDAVQFEEKGATFTQYHKVTDCFTKVTGANEQGLQVNIAKKSPLDGQAIPDKRGTMAGVLMRAASKDGKKYWNLWVRDMNDLDLKAERCGEEAPKPVDPEPNPGGGNGSTEGELPPVNPNGDLMFVSYVVGLHSNSTHRYLAIYNPTDQEIDLSNYEIRIAPYSSKHRLGTEVARKLSGKLGSRQVRVYGPTRGGTFNNGNFDKSLGGIIGSMNGNDNVAIRKNGKRVDTIGDFGGAWVSSSGDPMGEGHNKSIQRKFHVNTPRPNGFTWDEWETYPADNLSRLGKRW